jgi:hypothetical protein
MVEAWQDANGAFWKMNSLLCATVIEGIRDKSATRIVTLRFMVSFRDAVRK